MKFTLAIYLLLFLLMSSTRAYAECKEYKIEDYGDHVEAVCIGEPMSNPQKKEIEKQSEEALRQVKPTEQKASTENSQAPAFQTTADVKSKTDPPEEGYVKIESYDVKYLPGMAQKPKKVSTRQDGTVVEQRYTGEYSIKITAHNVGRRGTVRFKLKQTDFSGFELQSMSFEDDFEKDQTKTVTSVQPGNPVPYLKSNDWLIETFKF